MFIHFDSYKGAGCDDCGNPRTIMHMSVKRLDRSVNLCIACFWALAQAIRHASNKLPSDDRARIHAYRPDELGFRFVSTFSTKPKSKDAPKRS